MSNNFVVVNEIVEVIRRLTSAQPSNSHPSSDWMDERSIRLSFIHFLPFNPRVLEWLTFGAHFASTMQLTPRTQHISQVFHVLG